MSDGGCEGNVSAGGDIQHNHIPDRILGEKQLTRVRAVGSESDSIKLYTVEIGSIKTTKLFGLIPLRKVVWHPVYELKRGRWQMIAEQYAGAAALAEKFTWVDDYLEFTDSQGNHLAAER